MSISRVDGIPISGLVRIDGIAKAGLSQVDGLQPLPVETTPSSSGIPTPWAYWPFDNSDPWGSNTGTGQIAADSSFYLWARMPGGLYEWCAISDSSTNYQTMSGLASSRTSWALSVWLEPGERLDIYLTSGGTTVAMLDNETGTSRAHVLAYWTGSAVYIWQDGVRQSDAAWAIPTGSTVSLRLLGADCGISELAIWESPDWTPEQIASNAAAIYNSGAGAVFRNGAWQDLAAV